MAQSFSVYASGWKTVKAWWVYVSGAWRPVKNAWVYQSGAWRQFYSAITISGVPTSKTSDVYSVQFYGPNGAPADGHSISFTVSGGTAPYSVTLSKVSGDANFAINAAGPINYTDTTFLSASHSGSGPSSGTVLLTVTDANGDTGTTTCALTLL